jgi:hypothetical protein
LLLATLLLACSAAAPAGAGASVPWQKFLKAPGGGRINDIVGPDTKNRLTITSGIHLWRVGRNRKPVQFVKPHDGGRIGYLPDNPKFEPYIAQVPPTTHCGSFKTGDIWGFTGPRPRLVRITKRGVVKKGVSLPRSLEPSGIVFDTGGAFGYRLLVTERNRSAGTTGVLAIGCPGRSKTWVATGLPRIEGGLAIAPPTFGPYGGQLLGADEVHSDIYAISSTGALTKLISSTPGAPVGGDRGMESLGFVPPDVDGTSAAYLSDRRTPGNIQPGNGQMLTLSWAALQSQGVLPGDLLGATEGGAFTFVIRCTPGCTSFPVAFGQPDAHIEGHLVFAKRLARVR